MLSRFWNHNQPKTRWAPVSLGFFPRPPFGAVSLDFCLRARTCSEQLFCFVLFFPCWPYRKASLEGSQPSYWGGEWACLAWRWRARWFHMCPLGSIKKGSVKGFWGVLWRKGSRVLLRLLTWQAFLLSRVLTRCLWEFQRCSAGQGGPEGPPSSPALARTVVGRGLIPLLLTAFAPALLLPLIVSPRVQTKGRSFAHLVPLRLFLVGAILNFFLGPQKLIF